MTHMKKLRDCEAPLALFLGRARELGPKLGPILFQLPPNLGLDVYVYFNNDRLGNAVENALQLRRLLDRPG